MKISEITYLDIAEFNRMNGEDLTERDVAFLRDSVECAKSYMSNFTGLTIEELDDYPELVHPLKILCHDMYYNRSLYIDGSNNINKVLESFLGLHERNLL